MTIWLLLKKWIKSKNSIFLETLRKYPPATTTQRICEEPYRIPGSNVLIEKDTKVIVPIYAIHHDPLHYNNPDTFDPNRFLDKNKKLRNNYTYLPFGEGPRICIGNYLSKLTYKIFNNYAISKRIIISIEYNRIINFIFFFWYFNILRFTGFLIS